ncbi:hypothetical protein KM043_014887 [Ampulex compressa]|nr:hypothetical protein KM043_014887 [Ampulex compressa]
MGLLCEGRRGLASPLMYNRATSVPATTQERRVAPEEHPDSRERHQERRNSSDRHPMDAAEGCWRRHIHPQFFLDPWRTRMRIRAADEKNISEARVLESLGEISRGFEEEEEEEEAEVGVEGDGTVV